MSNLEDKQPILNGDIAVITDIQRYSVHDGPGIRSLVFFKGCPLRCRWCHNPETFNVPPELMFNEELCIGCGACVLQCPTQSISIVNGRIVTDMETCKVCGDCVDVCYADARQMSGKCYTVDEVVDEVIKDKEFYDNTNGGVTVSGGEALLHYKFVAKLFKKLRKKGIHTAIETSGYAPWENFYEVLKETDLVLFDVKHIDAAEHKKYTGQSNQLILENLGKIANMEKPVIVRTPYILGVNDGLEVMLEIAKIAKKINATELHLLPFHQIGTSKWDALKKHYPFRDIKEPKKEELELVKEKIEKTGISVVIGGN